MAKRILAVVALVALLVVDLLACYGLSGQLTDTYYLPSMEPGGSATQHTSDVHLSRVIYLVIGMVAALGLAVVSIMTAFGRRVRPGWLAPLLVVAVLAVFFGFAAWQSPKY